MAEPGAIPYILGCLWREAGMYSFRLNYASGVPTISRDNAKFLNTTITDTGTGVIDITMREAWLEIHVVNVQYIGTTDDTIARCDALTEGTTPAMTINVETAGSLADTDGDIDVTVMLYRTPVDS